VTAGRYSRAIDIGCSSISDLRSGDEDGFSVCAIVSLTGSGGGVVGGEEERPVLVIVVVSSVPLLCTLMVVQTTRGKSLSIL
jgi:hypothetical protein